LTIHIPIALPEPGIGGTLIDNYVALAILLLGGAAGAWILWKRARVVMLYVAITAGLLSTWTWSVGRYLVPIVPIIVWMLIAGTFVLASLKRWLRPLPWVVAATVIVTAVAVDVGTIRRHTGCRTQPFDVKGPCFFDIKQGFVDALSFIDRTAPRNAIVVTASDAPVGYLTGRRAMIARSVDARDSTRLLQYLRDHDAR